MVGALVTALFALKAGEREFDIALDAASVSAAIFTVAAAATGFLTFVDAFNPVIDAGPEFGAQLGRFLVETELGRTWLITTIAGAALTVLTFAVRSWTATFFVAILAVAALVPMGTQGHSGDEANHHAAIMALVLHIIAAAVWLGGLLLMVIVRPIVGRRTHGRRAMARYSSIALVAFVVVAIVGHGPRRDRRCGTWDALASPYGVILLRQGRRADRARRARRLVPAPPDRADARGCRHPAASGRSSRSNSRSWAIASGAAAALARTPPPANSAAARRSARPRRSSPARRCRPS